MSHDTAHSPTRVAVLDMGSNSIKLLVAEVSRSAPPRVLLEKSSGTRLGEGIHHHFQLSKAAMQRTIEAAIDFKQRCEELGALEWRAVATSAVRDALNGPEFAELFKVRMGFPLRILTGDEEAEWIYSGAISDPQVLGEHREFLVMDSGGGSAEWIRGDRVKIEKRICLDLGCVRMTDRFLRGDPYTSESFDALLEYYEKQLRPFTRDFSAKRCLVIGTGGSVCTAAAMDMGLASFRNRHVHGHPLTLDTLHGILQKLRVMTNAQRLEMHGLPKKRADIIVAGVALFFVAMRLFGAHAVTASLRGLRYGILLREWK